jgi:D-alanyl-D-alanine carboxypeptidase
MESAAALAAEALIRELHAAGFEDIRITSGYRSYEYQQILFNTYLGNEMKKHPDWTLEQCSAEVLTYSALPGESEHQTGLCVDLISIENVVLDETFAQHPAYAWLVDHAHFFGFILRYPEGKEGITGYSYEPWHFRFVGLETAAKIHKKGLTLEEFTD